MMKLCNQLERAITWMKSIPRAERLNRVALTALSQASQDKGVPSLDDLASFAIQSPSLRLPTFVTRFAQAVVPAAFSNYVDFDWSALRFYGSLTAGQKEVAADLQIRKKFILNRIKILQYSKVGNLTAIIGIDNKVQGAPLILSFLEEGGTKEPTAGPDIAIPLTGEAARRVEAAELTDEIAVESVEIRTSFLQWGPIIAGALVAAALSLVLITFGSAIGFGVLSSSPTWRDASPALTVASGSYLLLTALVSFGLGGYVAGRLRERWHPTAHSDVVEFRDLRPRLRHRTDRAVPGLVQAARGRTARTRSLEPAQLVRCGLRVARRWVEAIQRDEVEVRGRQALRSSRWMRGLP